MSSVEQNPYRSPGDQPNNSMRFVARSRLWKRNFWLSVLFFSVGLLTFVICKPAVEFVRSNRGALPTVLEYIIVLTRLISFLAWIVGLSLMHLCGLLWYSAILEGRRKGSD